MKNRPEKSGREACNGDLLTVAFTGKLKNGEIFDQATPDQPFQFTLGEGEVLPAFQEAVLGMKTGEKKVFSVPADKAFGEIRTDLVQRVPLLKLENPQSVKIGEFLEFELKSGEVLFAVVTDLTPNEAVVDFNHPLAGQDLNFSVEVLGLG